MVRVVPAGKSDGFVVQVGTFSAIEMPQHKKKRPAIHHERRGRDKDKGTSSTGPLRGGDDEVWPKRHDGLEAWRDHSSYARLAPRLRREVAEVGDADEHVLGIQRIQDLGDAPRPEYRTFETRTLNVT